MLKYDIKPRFKFTFAGIRKKWNKKEKCPAVAGHYVYCVG